MNESSREMETNHLKSAGECDARPGRGSSDAASSMATRGATVEAVLLDHTSLHYEPRFDIQPRSKREVAVRVLQAGICETDLQLVRGYMNFHGVLGHEFVGVAEEGPHCGCRVVGEINCGCGRCDWCDSGRRNHCPHRTVLGILDHHGGFASKVFVPPENLHRVPDSISDDQATLVEPLAAAYQIPTQVDLNTHRRAVVIGDGRLGYLIAQVLQAGGCEVTVVGKHEQKLARFADRSIATRLLEEKPTARDWDLAVDACGSVSGIPTALDYLRPRGTLVLKTTVTDPHSLSLAPLVIDEIQVVGSRCGPFAEALRALEEQRVEVDSLIGARFRLNQAEQAFQVAASGTVMKTLFMIEGGRSLESLEATN